MIIYYKFGLIKTMQTNRFKIIVKKKHKKVYYFTNILIKLKVWKIKVSNHLKDHKLKDNKAQNNLG